MPFRLDQTPVLLTILVLLLCASGSAFTATDTARAQQDEAAVYSRPLGIAMESYPYPYPVHFLTLRIEGQPLRMAYMDVRPSAEANGQAVVLLHGKNFYGSYWQNTITALRDTGFRVIVPDQIGFGKSAKPDIDYSFDLLAANTAQLLNHLGVKKVAVAGHSMGGMLAVRFARNYPERVSHLIMENPIGLEDYRFKVPPRTTEAVYRNELSETEPEQIRAFVRRYVVEWRPEVYERFVEVRARIARSGEYLRWAKASALTYQMIYRQPVRHEFGLIDAPTLLVIGQQDRTTLGRGQVSQQVLGTLGQYPQLGKDAARDIPNSRLLELEDIGHIPHLEAPRRFHQALLEFLNSHASGEGV